MNLSSPVNKILITLFAIAILVAGFFIHALAGFAASPVTFAEPPGFVQQYVSEHYGVEEVKRQSEDEPVVKLTKDYFNEAALVRNVMVDGGDPDELIRRFTDSDKATRVKIAFAFAEVNIKLSHDEGTGFDDKRVKFWEVVEPHSAAIQNALFEALIASAEENSRNFIPYTLAWWMQEQKSKALEMLTWAAKHHPDTWIRNFSVYYVVQFGGDEAHATDLISDRTHDPVYRVRKQVLGQRFRRFQEAVFGKEE